MEKNWLFENGLIEKAERFQIWTQIMNYFYPTSGDGNFNTLLLYWKKQSKIKADTCLSFI